MVITRFGPIWVPEFTTNHNYAIQTPKINTLLKCNHVKGFNLC